jgi:hypothetical protein
MVPEGIGIIMYNVIPNVSLAPDVAAAARTGAKEQLNSQSRRIQRDQSA